MRSATGAARVAGVAALSAAALALAAVPASAHGTEHHRVATSASGISLPVLMSPNVRLVATAPDTAAISGAFSRDGNYFYVSSTDSISVYDTHDPRHPLLAGVLPNLVFENEAMTYGERVVGGVLQRFVLVGVDLVEYSPTEPTHVHTGSGEVMIVDVTDPAHPRIRSRTPASTSTHTVHCVDPADCRYAYSAGDGGRFSVVDLTDLDAPRELKTVPSPAAGPNPVFNPGAGHYWDFDAAGIGWHTGSGGAAAFDVTDPANPVPIQATNAKGVQTPYNDFILHNSKRPNAAGFVPGAPPSLANGNVLLVTEEDYLNDGDEWQCNKAGTIQTWWVHDLDGAAYRAGNPTGAPSRGTVEPLDISNVPNEFGRTAPDVVGAFCSAHWFDVHPSGILAQGYYQQGVRFVDVRDPRNIRQYGYYSAGATEVWDAYFVPDHAAGAASGAKTNIVYVVDFVRGIDVLEVDLPTGNAAARTAGAAPGAAPAGGADGGAPPTVYALGAGALVTAAGVGLRRRRFSGAA